MTHEITPVEWLESRALDRPRDMARGLFIRELLELIDDSRPDESSDAAMCWHADERGDYCLCDKEYHWVWELPPPPEDFSLGPEYADPRLVLPATPHRA